MHPFNIAALLPLAQAAAPEAGGTLGSIETGDLVKLGILFVLSQLIAIVAYWIASKLVAADTSRFGNALKTWISYLLGVLILAFAGGVGIAITSGNTPIALAVGGLCFLLFIAMLFQVPMKIYDIGFGAAFGFLVISFILTAAGQLGLNQVAETTGLAPSHLKFSTGQGKRLEALLEKYVAMPGGSSADEAIASDAGKPLEERHAALQQIHRRLQQKHASLREGDQAALDAYNRDLARYEQLVEQLRTAQQ